MLRPVPTQTQILQTFFIWFLFDFKEISDVNQADILALVLLITRVDRPLQQADRP